jgi:hypothetical protein
MDGIVRGITDGGQSGICGEGADDILAVGLGIVMDGGCEVGSRMEGTKSVGLGDERGYVVSGVTGVAAPDSATLI